MNGRLLTAAEVAARYQVPTSQIYALTRRGELPAVRLGKYVRYRLDDLEAFEASFTNNIERDRRAA